MLAEVTGNVNSFGSQCFVLFPHSKYQAQMQVSALCLSVCTQCMFVVHLLECGGSINCLSSVNKKLALSARLTGQWATRFSQLGLQACAAFYLGARQNSGSQLNSPIQYQCLFFNCKGFAVGFLVFGFLFCLVCLFVLRTLYLSIALC